MPMTWASNALARVVIALVALATPKRVLDDVGRIEMAVRHEDAVAVRKVGRDFAGCRPSHPKGHRRGTGPPWRRPMEGYAWHRFEAVPHPLDELLRQQLLRRSGAALSDSEGLSSTRVASNRSGAC